jgi:hypothetical protein
VTRIELITHSLRCFVLGLLGLVPLLGIPASAMALVQYAHVLRRKGPDWNPAERYLTWGLFFGLLGLLLSFIISAIIGLAIVESVTSH